MICTIIPTYTHPYINKRERELRDRKREREREGGRDERGCWWMGGWLGCCVYVCVCVLEGRVEMFYLTHFVYN